MKFIHRSILFILLGCTQVTSAQTVEFYRKEILGDIRNLRLIYHDTVFKNLKTVDSLNAKFNTLINAVKTTQDISQLKIMYNYFDQQNAFVTASKEPEVQTSIADYLNRDLGRKLEFAKLSTQNLEGKFMFGNKKKIKINALFESEDLKKKTYRMHWNYFTGKSIAKLANAPGFVSNKLVNPYEVEIIVPGQITFWLVDVETNKVYYPDFEFRDFDLDPDNIDVFFKKTAYGSK